MISAFVDFVFGTGYNSISAAIYSSLVQIVNDKSKEDVGAVA